jgi:ferric-dicitrate binding protein FerR (iron transport regulator)
MKDKEYKYIENLISRSLNGEFTSEELHELKCWIEESPENKKQYLEIKDIWDLSLMPKSNTEEQLAGFYRSQYEKIQKSRRLWIRYSAAIAAVLLVGLLISILVPQNLNRLLPETTQVFSVPMGSRSKVLLADGTEVSLNSGSELKYSSNFSSANREVSLSGEAFFHVQTDKEHPFIVKTADFDIKVTGTQFNVNTYTENKIVSTSLAEGKIQIKMNSSDQKFDIRPNEKFELNRTDRKYSIVKADILSEISWKDGEFIFNQISFPDLVKRLERWYNVKLTYSDVELHKYAFTGRFKNQETIWQVLDALKLTMPIDYRKSTFREFVISYKPLKQN